MPSIHLTTFISAPAQRVFDLSRSIDFHVATQANAHEKAIAGKTSGLINLDETVTWQAVHLFKKRCLQVKITAMEPFGFFEDTMMQGVFASFSHQHHFKSVANGTIMIDLLSYEAPYSLLGKIAERIFLTRYLKRLLVKKNVLLKQYAGSGKWKNVLKTIVEA